MVPDARKRERTLEAFRGGIDQYRRSQSIRHRPCQYVSVLGLGGTTRSVAIEVDGNQLTSVPDVETTLMEQSYSKESDMDDAVKTVMVQISGLSMPVGKNFAMTWKMGM